MREMDERVRADTHSYWVTIISKCKLLAAGAQTQIVHAGH